MALSDEPVFSASVGSGLISIETDWLNATPIVAPGQHFRHSGWQFLESSASADWGSISGVGCRLFGFSLGRDWLAESHTHRSLWATP